MKLTRAVIALAQPSQVTSTISPSAIVASCGSPTKKRTLMLPGGRIETTRLPRPPRGGDELAPCEPRLGRAFAGLGRSKRLPCGRNVLLARRHVRDRDL